MHKISEKFKITKKNMSEEVKALVIDHGSYAYKVGLAGDEVPTTIFPSIIGFPNSATDETNDYYVGREVLARKSDLNIRHTIEHGIIKDWEYYTKIINHIYQNELHINSNEHPVLLTTKNFTPKQQSEKMIEIMFETFDVPSFYMSKQGYLSLISTGRTTGLSCDIGDGVSQYTPVYEGYEINHSVQCINFAGREITEWLQKILYEKNYAFYSDKEIVRDIKEKYCYVALDFDDEMKKAKSSSDCDVSVNGVTISDVRFRAPELLFRPLMNSFEFDGLDKIIYDLIMNCRFDFRNDLFSNIVMTGGSTLFKGLVERLDKELSILAPPTLRVRIYAPDGRENAAWIGGSIIASLENFPLMVLGKEEYNDYGPGIVHRKFNI